MDDKQIISLYLSRSESAIKQTAEKYGKYCRSIAFSVLKNTEDTEECVSDVYMKLWNAIPPNEPENLKAYIAKLTRNAALGRYEHDTAAKRAGNTVFLVFDELEECVADPGTVEETVNSLALTESLNRFLSGMKKEARQIFMLRYWFFQSVSEIAERMDIGEGKVKMSLLRSRNALKEHLRKEEFHYE